MRDHTIEETARLLGRNPGIGFERRRPGYQAAVHEKIVGGATISSPGTVANKNPKISDGMSRLVFAATGILAMVALSVWALAHLIGDEIAKAGHSDSTKVLETVLGNNVLEIPANMIRFRHQRRSGIHERLELYVHWPTLSGYTEALKEDFNSLKDEGRIIFMSLEPRAMSLDMSGRINPIYSRYFEGPAETFGYGLARRALSPDGGFVDEDLYYEMNSPYPFAARCVRETSKAGAPICIRDVHIGRNLTLTYRFHAKHLGEWLRLDQTVRKYVKSLIVTE